MNGSGTYSPSMYVTSSEPRCTCGHRWEKHSDRALVACVGLPAAASGAQPPFGMEHRCPCMGYEAVA